MRFSVRDRCMSPDNPDDAQRFERAMRRARVPWRFWDADVERVKGNNTWLKEWCADPNRTAGDGVGFYIHGNLNTGKSAVASIMMREFVLRALTSVWLGVNEVPRVMFNDDDDATTIQARLRRADMVVIDDLGAERFRLTGGGGGALEQIIRDTYHRQRTLVITSNVAWEQMPVVFGAHPAIVSLLQRAVRPVKLSQSWGA